MITYRDLIHALREVELDSHSRVIAHVSLSALGSVSGGAQSVVGALISSCESVLMPAFTLRTMITPRVGPPENALDYNDAEAHNKDVEFFHPDMPVDPGLGIVAETFRRHPEVQRSHHPLLSFSGIHAEEAIRAQSLEEPWGAVHWLTEFDGDVLLVGVNHTANVSLHYAELRAGRSLFTRWALTHSGVVTCPASPGCPDGFNAILPKLEGIVRVGRAGDAELQAVPLRDLVNVVVGWIRQDPRALLCDRLGCERCAAIRKRVRASPGAGRVTTGGL